MSNNSDGQRLMALIFWTVFIVAMFKTCNNAREINSRLDNVEYQIDYKLDSLNRQMLNIKKQLQQQYKREDEKRDSLPSLQRGATSTYGN